MNFYLSTHVTRLAHFIIFYFIPLNVVKRSLKIMELLKVYLQNFLHFSVASTLS